MAPPLAESPPAPLRVPLRRPPGRAPRGEVTRGRQPVAVLIELVPVRLDQGGDGEELVAEMDRVSNPPALGSADGLLGAEVDAAHGVVLVTVAFPHQAADRVDVPGVVVARLVPAHHATRVRGPL